MYRGLWSLVRGDQKETEVGHYTSSIAGHL
jgi:hypothetical protein